MQQPGSITFGTPIAPVSSAPPAFGATGGLPFSAAPTFGATATPAFGAAGTMPAFGGSTTSAFGASATPSFGANATPSFGASANPAPAFGGATSTGLSFGSTGLNTGLKFGSTTTTTATPSLFGGLNTSTPATGLSFGAQPAATTATTGFSFGATATPGSTGLNFGTPTSNTGFSLNTSTAAPGALNFGAAPSQGFGLSGFKPATTSTGLSLTTTTTAPLNFGTLGASTSTAPSLFGGGLTSGLFAQKPPTTSVGLTPIISQPPASVGLGGVDNFLNKPGTTGATTTEADGKLAKDNLIPNEFAQLMEGFKNHVKQQKLFSSDVARGTIKPLRQIQENIDSLKLSLTEIGNGLITNRQTAEKLKYDTAKCLLHAEMAQRTHDTPPGFQFDNIAPLQFFIETVNQFERDLASIRQQIEGVEKHMQSLEQPKMLTSQEMALGMKRLHETFVALAGRLQSLHTQVELQKDQYLNLRKHLFKDSTNIFEKPGSGVNSLKNTTSTISSIPPKRAAGPTPFSAFGNAPLGFISQAQPVNSVTSAPPPAYPGLGNTLNWGSVSKPAQPPSYNASINLTNTSLFAGLNQSNTPTSDNFQLQKPPTGNKRGKH